MRSMLVIPALLGLGLAAHAQIPVEVRPAEPVDAPAAPAPEVRLA